jgi:CitMHS family citrate-Mg2+:H+ or citrate-Ca2+:H+ symporter
MLAFIGFLMVIATIYLLLKGKSNPITVMIIVPVIAALIVGTNFEELGEYVGAGVETVMSNAVLFIFSIIFFGVMQDLGVFDPMVNWLTERAGTNIIAITVVTAIIGIVAHLDGATATTVLITIPAMYPIYKALGIKTEVLLCLTTASMGVMNLLPWGGPVARVAAVLGLDANDLWLTLIPVQIFGIIVILSLAVWLGFREKRRMGAVTLNPSVATSTSDIREDEEVETTSAGEDLTNDQVSETSATDSENEMSERNRRTRLFNTIWTVLVVGFLIWNQLPAYLVFMIGLSVTFIINFPSTKEQNDVFKKHAGAALTISATMLAAGVMVGIMDGTGMIEEMARVLTGIIPDILGRFTHVIFGIFALPMGLMVSTDAYFFGFMPPILEVGAQFDVEPINTALAMLVGKNLSLMISPLVPATFLALGLVDDVDYQSHLKFSMKYVWLASLIMLLFAFLVGIIQF